MTISIDAGGAKEVKPFLVEHGYTMPALLDADSEVFTKNNFRGTPGTLVVDRQGKVVARGMGPVDFDHPDFRKYILGLVAKK